LKPFWSLALGFVWLQVASATPVCSTQSLAGYIALGAGGCTIGADTVASFMTLTGFATPINTASITVTPSGGTFNPELTFSVSQAVSGGTVDEAIFNYTISGPAYTTDVINLSGSSETVDGAVTDTQNYCVGGHFGPDGVDGCTGSTSGALVAVDGAQQSDNTSFANPHSLNITDDFVLDSGTAGTASGGTFSDQFTAVPEPGVFLLTGTGLVLAMLRKSQRVNRKL